jgi:hypothetical protein
MNRLFVFLLFATAVLHAADSAQPVFVKARCDKKLSSIVLSTLKDGITASGKYRLVSSLDDEGKLDVIHTVYMVCEENNDVAAVATQYGIARCHSTKECGSVNDGESLNVALCNANLAADCGRALYKALDYYVGMNRPLKLNY